MTSPKHNRAHGPQPTARCSRPWRRSLSRNVVRFSPSIRAASLFVAPGSKKNPFEQTALHLEIGPAQRFSFVSRGPRQRREVAESDRLGGRFRGRQARSPARARQRRQANRGPLGPPSLVARCLRAHAPRPDKHGRWRAARVRAHPLADRAMVESSDRVWKKQLARSGSSAPRRRKSLSGARDVAIIRGRGPSSSTDPTFCAVSASARRVWAGLDKAGKSRNNKRSTRGRSKPTRAAPVLRAEEQAHDLLRRRRGAIRHDERRLPSWPAIVNEAGTTGNTGEPAGADEQDRIGHWSELDRARLHTPHRLAVGDVQGLIFGEPAPEHVALPSELFELSFERRDPVLGVTPRRRQLMNVRVRTALRECRRERASERIPQTANLLELDARERLGPPAQGQKTAIPRCARGARTGARTRPLGSPSCPPPPERRAHERPGREGWRGRECCGDRQRAEPA